MNAEKELKIVCEKNYGEYLYYPACYRSSLFAKIAGTKTLTPKTISFIKKLGYSLAQERIKL